MRKVLFTFFILIISINLFAGDFPIVLKNNANNIFYKKKFRRKVFSSNAVYFEAAGLAYKWSINYDRVLSSTDNSLLTLRIGYGMFKDEKGKSVSKVPMTVNVLIGKKHFLEMGGGGVYSNTTYNSFVPAADFGYRYQNPKGGIVVRVLITATYEGEYYPNGREKFHTIEPYAGVSLGYNF